MLAGHSRKTPRRGGSRLKTFETRATASRIIDSNGRRDVRRGLQVCACLPSGASEPSGALLLHCRGKQVSDDWCAQTLLLGNMTFTRGRWAPHNKNVVGMTGITLSSSGNKVCGV